jgi:CelD/BcsL family acetyltransferase involved in cellulose biosynthesis
MRSLASVSTAVHHGDPSALESVWAPLVDPRHPGAAFRSAAWLTTWWKHHRSEREPYVLIARQGLDVIGLLPLYRERTPLGGSRLRLMGDGMVGSDYLGAIARPADVARVGERFVAELARANPDELELDGLAADDPLVAALVRAYGPRVAVEPRYRCPFVAIRGGFDAYLAALPDGIAAQWHRRRRWLERQPGYRLDLLRSPAEIAVGIEVLFELHRQRWALEGGSDGIVPAVEPFHRESARRLAALGFAYIFVLHVDGAPRAALYGFRHGDRFAFYQSGHEPAWRPRSIGTVLLGHVIRSSFADGLTEFDFLHGSEPYKLRWATGFRETVRVRALGLGVRPWLNEAARDVRERVKRALPVEALDWLRRARRQWSAR